MGAKTGSVPVIPIIVRFPRSPGRRVEFRGRAHDLQKAIREQVTQQKHPMNSKVDYLKRTDTPPC